MNRDQFVDRHAPGWQRLDALLAELEGRRLPSHHGPAEGSAVRVPEVAALPELYRRLCHQLALARSRSYGGYLVERLNQLALRGNQQLYAGGAASSWEAIGRFVTRDFPRHVRREGRLVGVAAALFFGSLLATLVAVRANPDLAFSILGPGQAVQFEQMYDPESQEPRPADTDFGMFGHYVYNNISIAFRTFASGLVAGIGAVVILLYNGLMIGAVAGHLGNSGLGETFYPFVIAHGAFELIAIVLAGAAGLRLGLALLAPGRLSRGRAISEAARGAVPLVFGLTGMLLVAAFIEAYWSSTVTLPLAVRYGVGAALWVLVVAYLLFAGKGAAKRAAKRTESRHGP